VALDYLIDTSVIFRLGTPTVRAVVEPLVAAGRVGRAGITDLEVGYGGRNAREWDNAQNDLSVFRSQRGRKISDLLIAAAAERAGLTVLHYDGDYDIIAKVTGQRCEWVVPAETVD
jgi:predicted nucleic acid-binding protein